MQQQMMDANGAPPQQATLANIQHGTLMHIAGGGGYGFIKPDSGEADVFTMPPHAGFPPIGTRVNYTVVIDPKNGKLRADNLQVEGQLTSSSSNVVNNPLAAFQESLAAVQTAVGASSSNPGLPGQSVPGAAGKGMLTHIAGDGRFGFIKPDSGEADLFALPPLTGFPAVGTRVTYNVVLDKNGKIRADNLHVEGAQELAPVSAGPAFSDQVPTFGETGNGLGDLAPALGATAPALAPGATPAATSAGCPFGDIAAFGQPGASFSELVPFGATGPALSEALPALGDASSALALNDPGLGVNLAAFGLAETGPALGDVGLASALGQATPDPLAAATLSNALATPEAAALLAAVTGGQDISSLQGPQVLEAIRILTALQGAQVQLQQGAVAAAVAAPALTMESNRQSGVMRYVQQSGRFGFIKPDSGGPDILALPPRDVGFPEVGTHVLYDVTMDEKTGRPKADNIMASGQASGAVLLQGHGPAAAAAAAAGLRSSPYPAVPMGGFKPRSQGPVTQPGDMIHFGVMSAVNDKFAFIKQDSGDADMFCIPPSCEAFGRELPPVGTRVQYRVVMDAKTGRPRADQVAPAMI
mmetsp:Transcript_29138/g.79986  ORF Transcript_29138/g.79986 Transcript_29138/m.79986 type:complete len:587 (-) Transcript_29138:131-1891(-)